MTYSHETKSMPTRAGASVSRGAGEADGVGLPGDGGGSRRTNRTGDPTLGGLFPPSPNDSDKRPSAWGDASRCVRCGFTAPLCMECRTALRETYAACTVGGKPSPLWAVARWGVGGVGIVSHATADDVIGWPV